jgi:hypothetical protein
MENCDINCPQLFRFFVCLPNVISEKQTSFPGSLEFAGTFVPLYRPIPKMHLRLDSTIFDRDLVGFARKSVAT